jgi:hypothetical protein
MLKVGPPSVLGLDAYGKRALSCELPLWPEIPLKILRHKLVINFVTVAMYIHMTFACIASQLVPEKLYLM